MSQRRFVQYTRNALLRGIPRELLRQEKIVSGVLSVAPGEVIFEEGDPPDYCYLVGGGAVRITRELAGGEEELLAMIEPGDFFGELALYDSSPRSARASAAVPTRLGRVDLEAFQYLRRVAPLQIASNLAERSIQRVRRTNDRLVSDLSSAGRLSSIGSDLATLSHNLRSPLATIRNAADILDEWLAEATPQRDEVPRFVEIIRQTADRALLQIDELMARLRGEPADVRTRVTVASLLRELRQVTRAYASPPRVRYDDEDATAGGAVIVARTEIVAALANLVKNAVEALPPGGGDVRVSAAADGIAVVFSVSDSGVGIPPELQPRIFERSFTHGKEGGTGLGLFHVRSVAQRHGGRVEVDSEVGRGTTVRLRLPRAPASGT